MSSLVSHSLSLAFHFLSTAFLLSLSGRPPPFHRLFAVFERPPTAYSPPFTGHVHCAQAGPARLGVSVLALLDFVMDKAITPEMSFADVLSQVVGPATARAGAWSGTAIRDTSCWRHPLTDVPDLRFGPRRPAVLARRLPRGSGRCGGGGRGFDRPVP